MHKLVSNLVLVAVFLALIGENVGSAERNGHSVFTEERYAYANSASKTRYYKSNIGGHDRSSKPDGRWLDFEERVRFKKRKSTAPTKRKSSGSKTKSSLL